MTQQRKAPKGSMYYYMEFFDGLRREAVKAENYDKASAYDSAINLINNGHGKPAQEFLQDARAGLLWILNREQTRNVLPISLDEREGYLESVEYLGLFIEEL